MLVPCQIMAQTREDAGKAAANESAPDRAFREWLAALRSVLLNFSDRQNLYIDRKDLLMA
jgi:hypothetical protein